jgi:hypothetical protein
VSRNNYQSYSELPGAINKHPDWKRVMCFGDSWFQLPGPKAQDIQKVLPRIFRETLFFNEGVAGRDSDMLRKGRARVTKALKTYEFDVLLLSMGGNDVVGKELRSVVKKKDDPQDFGDGRWTTAPQQVLDHIKLSMFQARLDIVRSDVVDLVQRRDAQRTGCDILIHTYDYIWPDGRAFKLGPFKGGPWVKPHLDKAGLPDLLDQRVVSTWLLDQFAALLAKIAADSKRFHVVDSRGVLTKQSQWADEIHPVQSGFRQIAEQAWKPVLQRLL